MNAKRLQELGLSTQDGGAGMEAELELTSGPLLNPLSRRYIERVQFTLLGDRLLAIGPAEMVGLPPLSMIGVQNANQLEQQLNASFDAHIQHLQRRSSELQALGISSKVDPESLELSAQLEHPPFHFELLADKQGQFRVGRIFRHGAELQVPAGQPFELSEFRERNALAGYLLALFSPGTSAAAAIPEPTVTDDTVLLFSELSSRLGGLARVPPRSAVEVLVELRAQGLRYRFAAARLSGHSFRGLLAGPAGKLWAERFELNEFSGPAALLASVLHLPVDAVEVLRPGDEG